MKLATLLAALAFVAVPAHVAADPVAHAAAVCADYPNQAAAQQAADTRDGDGDGIYCEDLPCPCAGARSTPSPAPMPVRKPATFTGKCKRGRLPDRSCSPGVVATTSVTRVCTPGYTGRVRD